MAKRDKPRASERRYAGTSTTASVKRESRGAESSESRKARAFIEQARDRFEQAEQAEKSQRAREKEDIRVYNGDQWEQEIRSARAGQNPQNGLPPTPAKPCLTINKVRAPVNQVINQERQADMGIELVPADDFGGQVGEIGHEEIELREGLIRRIQRQSGAKDARSWAFARAVQAGRGFYGVTIDWTGKGFDQDIKIVRYYNQFSVSLDPFHEQPDGSDAEWAFVGMDMSFEAYRAQFGKNAKGERNKVAEADDAEWRQLGDEAPKWFTYEGKERSVRVVDYYYKVHETTTIYQLEDGSVVEQLPEGAEPINTRTLSTTKVKLAKIDGIQVLEETDWPGQYIPIVKVLGTELQPYDRERRVEGVVRPSIDSQRGFNYMISEWVFRMALAPLPPIMLVEGQQDGYEEWYKQANVRALPYLPYKQTDTEGRLVANPPFRPDVSIPIAEYAQSTNLFDQTIKDTTDVSDPALGNLPPGVKSGKLAQIIIQRSQQGNSNYLDNLRRSMEYEGRIINDLLYPIYGRRPGRLLSIMTGNNETQPVIYGQPMVQSGEGKQMQAKPAQEGQPGAKEYRLTPDAEWNVAIKISKSYDTRREQQATEMGELISAAPEMMMPVIGDLWFASQDGPGAQEMAKRMKAMLAPQVQQMLHEGQGPSPEQMQQQLAQAQKLIEGLSQELDAKTKLVETEAVKAQQRLSELQTKEAAENQRALAELQTKEKLEMAKLALEHRKLELQAEIEAAKLGNAQSLARLQAEQEMLHQHGERQMQAEAQDADAAQADLDRQAAMDQAEADRAFQGEQGERDRQTQAQLAAEKAASRSE